MDEPRPRRSRPIEHDTPEQHATRTPAQPTSRRVLLVEDEPLLRELFVRLLEEQGLDVVDVGDAHAALDRIYTAAAPFDLLVTDNGMPGMSGAELARRVRQVWPSLPILCVTGRPPTKEEAVLRTAGAAPARWLLKPVTPEEFVAAVWELLEP